MGDKFKDRLQNDINQNFKHQSFILSISLIFLFFIFSYVPQYIGVSRDKDFIVRQFETLLISSKRSLIKFNTKILPSYINSKIDKEEMLRQYNLLNSHHKWKASIFVLDNQKRVIFQSNQLSSTNLNVSLFIHFFTEKVTNEKVSYRFYTDSDNQRYLILAKRIDINNSDSLWSLLIYNGIDFSENLQNTNSKFMISDDYDRVFSTTGNQFLELSNWRLNRSVHFKWLIFFHQNLYINKSKLINHQFYIDTYRPVINPIFIFSVALMMSFIILLILTYRSKKLSLLIAKRNASIIEEFQKEMEAISKGIKDELSIDTGDEFSFLAGEINKMLTEVRQLNLKTVNLKKERILFETKILELQFNPHFLYNTLETILITSQLDAKLTEKIVLELTTILRYSLKSEDDKTTLENDLTIIQSYLNITKIRFEDFTFQFDIDESLKNQTIPKLFLLPLIENAIKYGFKYRHDLNILLQVKKIEKDIVFLVIDNGPGIKTYKKDKLLKTINTSRSHHGLSNSYKRLTYFFGEVELIIDNLKDKTIIGFKIKGK